MGRDGLAACFDTDPKREIASSTFSHLLLLLVCIQRYPLRNKLL